jgi:hypothetical protein
MSRERLLRRVLWAAVASNVAGAYLFGFPKSWLGQLVSFPSDVPPIYRAFTALFVLLFGGAYAYLASQLIINRPLVAFGAVGKASAFVAVVVLWLLGQATAMALVVFSADLALAVLFFWCLGGLGAQQRHAGDARNARA